MKLLETTPTRLLVGTAAASLAALGIAFVASSVEAPRALVDEDQFLCVERATTLSPPPPPIVPDTTPLPPPPK